MCKNNATTTGKGQQSQGSGCTCTHAATGGCGSQALRFLAQKHEQPLGVVHVVDPSLIQVDLPNGKSPLAIAELV